MTGYLLAWGQFVAGVLDALENLLLLSMLDQDFGSGLPYLAWMAASLKFMLVGAGLLYVLAGLVRRLRGHWNWILAYLYFERVPLAGSLMLVALAYLGVAGPATTRNLRTTGGSSWLAAGKDRSPASSRSTTTTSSMEP